MSVTLPKSFGFKKRVHDDGPGAKLHAVDCEHEVIKMNWVGKKGHVKRVGSWDWTNHHFSYSAKDAGDHPHHFSHYIHLYADSHGHPDSPTHHVRTHATVKIDLLKQELGAKLTACNNDLYFQSHYKIGIHWHHHHLKMQVKNPKTGVVMVSKEIPYHNNH